MVDFGISKSSIELMGGAFTRDQLKRWANIFDNAGQVFLASAAVPSLLESTTGSLNPKLVVLAGASGTVLFWWISLKLERMSS